MLLIHSILFMANRVLYMTMLMLVIFQWLHKATSIHLKQSMAKTLFPDVVQTCQHDGCGCVLTSACCVYSSGGGCQV